MMKRIAGLFFVLFFVPLSCLAGDTALEIAERVNSRELFQQAFTTSFDAQMVMLKKSGKATDDQIAQIKEEALAFANRVYDDPDFLSGIAEIYAREFTQSELETILAFYRTPAGEKMVQKMPTLFQAGAKVGQSLAGKYQADFTQKVQMIMQGGEPLD